MSDSIRRVERERSIINNKKHTQKQCKKLHILRNFRDYLTPLCIHIFHRIHLLCLGVLLHIGKREKGK